MLEGETTTLSLPRACTWPGATSARPCVTVVWWWRTKALLVLVKSWRHRADRTGLGLVVQLTREHRRRVGRQRLGSSFLSRVLCMPPRHSHTRPQASKEQSMQAGRREITTEKLPPASELVLVPRASERERERGSQIDREDSPLVGGFSFPCCCSTSPKVRFSN